MCASINLLTQQKSFSEIQSMIKSARFEASRQANKILINLYWSIGKYVSEKIASAEWGQNVVTKLSEYLTQHEPGLKGFSARNIWRMRKFYDTYKTNEKLSTLLTEFPVSAENVFKDSYLFEFTGLPDEHQESDLQSKLIKHLKQFLLEMGPDFSFIKEQFLVQVGDSDFRIDLLLQHRGLNCLVAIELKVTDFQPEYLGKLQFYLETLDRDVKKPHENPSIGLLICKSKNTDVVEYAMSRNISPAVIADYQTQLIDKSLLQKKLNEISAVIESETV